MAQFLKRQEKTLSEKLTKGGNIGTIEWTDSMHLDSNIVIGFANGILARPIANMLSAMSVETVIACSVIVEIESMGYSKITPHSQSILSTLFSKMRILYVSPAIKARTIALLQQGIRLKLPDAIIAATVLERNSH